MFLRCYFIAALTLFNLALTGCYGHLVSDGDETHDITFGQTVRGNFKPMSQVRLDFHESIANAHTYRFRAKEGTWVTVTARSSGPNILLWLNKGFRPFMGSVGSSAFAFSEWPDFDPTPGTHAEIFVPLTRNDEDEYAIEVRSREPGPYTLTLTQGIAPNLELWKIPTPLPPTQGEYPCPFKKDNSITPWMLRIMETEAIGQGAGEVAGTLLFGGTSEGSFGSVLSKFVSNKIAVNSAGGWDVIQAESDYSFNSALDLALYMHLKYAAHPQYQTVLHTMQTLYPGFDNAVLYASGRHWGRWFPVR